MGWGWGLQGSVWEIRGGKNPLCYWDYCSFEHDTPLLSLAFSLSDTRPHVYTDARKIQLHQLKGFFIEIQTHERFKRTLLIRTKHSLQILGVISSYKTTLQQQLNGEKRWKMRWKDKPLIGFWLSYVVFLSIAWKRLRYVVFLSSARKRFFHHCIEKQPRFFQALDRKTT